MGLPQNVRECWATRRQRDLDPLFLLCSPSPFGSQTRYRHLATSREARFASGSILVSAARSARMRKLGFDRLGTEDERLEGLALTRVAVILHERRGNWAGQLRTRLQDRPVRWIETRSAADLDAALLGLACPVVLIDLRNDPAQGLNDLDRVLRQSPAARILVLDPEEEQGVVELARELGAAQVISGFVPPPEVANLLDRWIKLAVTQIEREGWSRSLPVEVPIDPESWLESTLVDLAEKARERLGQLECRRPIQLALWGRPAPGHVSARRT